MTKLNRQATSCYVLSPCCLAAAGIVASLNSLGVNATQPEENALDLPATPLAAGAFTAATYIAYIPNEPSHFLTMLIRLGKIIDGASPLPNLIVISDADSIWLLKCLAHHTANVIDFRKIYVISPRLRHPRFLQLLTKVCQGSACHNTALGCFNLLGIEQQDGLTLRETEALITRFAPSAAYPVKNNVRVSTKTLYGQRLSGLKKIARFAPGLLKTLPGIRQRLKVEQTRRIASRSETDLLMSLSVQAFQRQYRPVCNPQGALCGFEISLSWREQDKHADPYDVLIKSRNHSLKELITAILIESAVHTVSQYCGDITAWIKVPPALAEKEAWQALSTALLSRPRIGKWRQKIVFTCDSALQRLDFDATALPAQRFAAPPVPALPDRLRLPDTGSPR